MSIRIEAGLRTLVLALYDEAALTAATKGLTGTLGQMAALRETASLASAPARRTVSEEEVMRVLLAARRTRRAILLPDAPLRTSPGSAPGPADAALSGASLRLRRGRLAAWAMRSLSRPGAALV
ncbi:hypothetical protein [Azospirillum doebereinerae]|uniref:Uncharacterized protein n=1 Tax=Azospirillum doebereinerae TaxID=92933 RepID=A0A433JC26_9PROT|nr:hypothetical protein [Azospirillum doebereinerae]MCG5239648.1 hypothetical protein [Azospirillum doebereinerae]RUQ74117.1 hypothetical protein EJ913_07065 [Azospirillum doebereinerae]